MSALDRLAICHRCPDRGAPAAGVCPCRLDGDDIVEHAREAYCPAGRYNLGVGDWIATLTHRVRLRRLAQAWARWTGRPCGCAARQRRANLRMRGLTGWIQQWGHL